MKEELIDNEFTINTDDRNEDDLLLNYHFRLTFNEAVERESHKAYWKPKFKSDRNSVITFLILGSILLLVGYAQGDNSGYVMYGIGGTFIFFSILVARSGLATKKANTALYDRIVEEQKESPEYELFLNEDHFGQTSFMGKSEYKWTKEVNIEIRENQLYIKQWKGQAGALFILSGSAIGDEKFDEVVKAVQGKLKRIRESQK